MTYFQIRKKRKWFHCETSRFWGVFQYTFLKKLRKNYSKFVWLPRKKINAIQLSNFHLQEIIVQSQLK